MEYISIGAKPFLWAVCLLALIVFSSGRAGGVLLYFCGFRRDELSGSEAGVLSIACGLTLLSLAVLAIGLAGFLAAVPVSVVLLIFIIFPFFFEKNNLFGLPDLRALRLIHIDPLAVLLLIPLTLSFLQCFTPPIANDALVYHLAHAKEFVLGHRITQLPFTSVSLWPYQMEMLFSLGLLLQGTSLAQLFHWIFYGLTVYSVYLFGLRFHGRETGRFAALVFAFTPLAFAESSQAYNDLAMVFYIFLAFYIFMLADSRSLSRWAFLSGFLCGAAMGMKYLGLAAGAIFLSLWGLRFRNRWRPLMVFCGGCVLVSGVWYARSWVLTGNPVYPFFHSIFGNGFAVDLQNMGMGRGVFQYFLLLWNVTLYPVVFGGELIGPLYLIFLPLLPLFVRRSSWREPYAVLFVGLFTLFLFMQAQLTRYFFYETPFLAVGVGLVLSRLRKGAWIRRLALFVLSTVILMHSALFFYRTRDAWPLFFGKVSAQDYLRRMERSYRGYEYLREHARSSAKLFNAGETRDFYNPNRHTVREGAPLTRLLAGRGLSLEQYLDEQHFDVIWLREDSDPALLDYVKKRSYALVFSYEFTEKPAVYKQLIYQAA